MYYRKTPRRNQVQISDQVPEVMVKVNINLYFTPEQAVKAQRGNRRIALFFV